MVLRMCSLSYRQSPSTELIQGKLRWSVRLEGAVGIKFAFGSNKLREELFEVSDSIDS